MVAGGGGTECVTVSLVSAIVSRLNVAMIKLAIWNLFGVNGARVLVRVERLLKPELKLVRKKMEKSVKVGFNIYLVI
jgi:hypothetical protein